MPVAIPERMNAILLHLEGAALSRPLHRLTDRNDAYRLLGFLASIRWHCGLGDDDRYGDEPAWVQGVRDGDQTVGFLIGQTGLPSMVEEHIAED